MEAYQAMLEAQNTVECCSLVDDNPINFCDVKRSMPAYSEEFLQGTLWEQHISAGNFDALWKIIDSSFPLSAHTASEVSYSKECMMYYALRASLQLKKLDIHVIDAINFCHHAQGHYPLSTVKNELRDLLIKACDAVKEKRKKAYSQAIQQAVLYIHAHYQDYVSVDMLADVVHYSPAHLSTLFRQETGVTIGEMLLHTRLDAAMEALRSTPDTVAAIAMSTGYRDVQYFSRVFKHYTGMTPMEYRRKAISP